MSLDSCMASCPEWAFFTIVGIFVCYALVGTLLYFLVKSFKDDLDWEYIIFFIVAWPILIVIGIAAGIVWYLASLLGGPFINATKYELKDVKNSIENKIEKGDNKIMDYLKYEYKPSRKKAEPTKKVDKKAKKKK